MDPVIGLPHRVTCVHCSTYSWINGPLVEVALPRGIVLALISTRSFRGFLTACTTGAIKLESIVERDILICRTKQPSTLLDYFLESAKRYFRTQYSVVGVWFIDFYNKSSIQITSSSTAIATYSHAGLLISYLDFPLLTKVQIKHVGRRLWVDSVTIHLLWI